MLKYYNNTSLHFILNINSSEADLIGNGYSYFNDSNRFGESDTDYLNNNFIIKGYEIITRGCQGLRKYPTDDIPTVIFRAGLLIEYHNCFNLITHEYVPSITQHLSFHFNELNTFVPMTKFISNNFIYANQTYISEYSKLHHEVRSPNRVIYDNLGVNPIYHNRECYLDIVLTIEN